MDRVRGVERRVRRRRQRDCFRNHAVHRRRRRRWVDRGDEPSVLSGKTVVDVLRGFGVFGVARVSATAAAASCFAAVSPPPPFPPPPPPAKWGWKLGSDDDVLDGEVVFVSSAADVAMSGDGTRIAIGAPYANETPGFSSGRRARVFQYQSGRWDKIGSDLLGDGKNDGFANKLCLSNDGTRVVIAAKTSGVNDTGLVQVYDEKGGNWTQVAEDLTGDDDFVYYGSDVAISKNTGERVFVAGGKRSLAGVSGVVRAYEVSEASGDPEDNIREWVQVGKDLTLASPNISLSLRLNRDSNYWIREVHRF